MRENARQPVFSEQMTTQTYQYGKVIKHHRVALGLTQRQVANHCGITDSALAHFERGLRLPSEPVADGIAKALQLKGQVLAEFHAGLKAAREEKVRKRVQRSAHFLKAGGVAPEAPDPEEIARQLAEDPELHQACLHLQAALRKPGQKAAVLRALEAWASKK